MTEEPGELVATEARAEYGDGTAKTNMYLELHRDQERTRQWLAGQARPGSYDPGAAFATGAIADPQVPSVRRPGRRAR